MGLFDKAHARGVSGWRSGTKPKVSASASEDSIYVGYPYDSETDTAGDPIRYEGERHLLIFGPNGSGKGTRFLVPNLLGGLENRSVIVIDPKGELAAITADHRRSLGHDVVILNPFNVLGLGSAGFNPLDNLDPELPHFYDDAAGIGEALIKIEAKDPHWSELAQGLMVALVMWEKQQQGDKASLRNVRWLLTQPDKYKTFTNAEGKEYVRQIAGLRVTARTMSDQGGEIVASLAGRFTHEREELASIQSTADTQTRWMLSPPMKDDMAKGGIVFSRLKDRPTTVYVILPAERLRSHAVWLRLVIVSALRSLYKSGGLRTLILLDEMAALGHLGPIEDAFGLVRGYKVQLAAICQDLNQLKALYNERWETFIANAGVVFAFAPNDLTTADWMSRRAGQTTVVARNYSENVGTSAGDKATLSTGSGSSDQQIARPLYLPHDLIGLEEGMGMLWLAGLRHSKKIFAPPYYDLIALEGRDKPNPYRPQGT